MARSTVALLDLGGVILRLDFRRLFRELGCDSQESAQALMRRMDGWPCHDEFERGRLTETEFRLRLSEWLGRPFSAETFHRVWNSIFDGAVSGVRRVLEEVSRQAPLFALTNSNPSHIAFAQRHYPEMGLFRKVFTSYELGARKPEPEAYLKAARAIGVSPEEIFYVDDREENVQAARTLGMTAALCADSARELEALLRTHLKTVP